MLSNLKKKMFSLFCAGRWMCLATGRLLSSMFHTGYKSLTRRFMWGLFGSLRRSSVGRWENDLTVLQLRNILLKAYIICAMPNSFYIFKPLILIIGLLKTIWNKSSKWQAACLSWVFVVAALTTNCLTYTSVPLKRAITSRFELAALTWRHELRT